MKDLKEEKNKKKFAGQKHNKNYYKIESIETI